MPQFAPPGDPLIMGTNEISYPKGRPALDFSLTVPNASTYNAKIRRSIKEFPADGQTQTIVNAVLVYSMLGMSPIEIGTQLGVDYQEILRIKSFPAFQETFGMLFAELLSVNSNSLQARIAAYAGNAIENVFELASSKPTTVVKINEDGEEYEAASEYAVPPIVILKANQDILDRSGLAKDILFGKGSGGDNAALEIVITTEGDSKTEVKIKGNR